LLDDVEVVDLMVPQALRKVKVMAQNLLVMDLGLACPFVLPGSMSRRALLLELRKPWR